MRTLIRKLTLILLFFIVSSSYSQWVQQGLPTATGINGMYFTDSLNGWICAGRTSVEPGVSDSGIILRTTNGGVNWIKQKDTINNPLYAIKMADANNGYCVGGYRTILKTSNGGSNWNQLPDPGFGNYFSDIALINKDTFYVSGITVNGGIWKTTNGGSSFIQQFSGRIMKLDFITEQTGWAIYTSFYLYKTTNGGMNWLLQKNFPDAQSNLQFIDENTGWIIGGSSSSSSGVLKTTDGGLNWVSQSLPPNAGHPGAIFMLNKNYGWTGSSGNRILKTINGGDNWILYSSMPISESYHLFFADSLHGWASDFGIAHTTNGGATFIQPVSSNQPTDYILKQNYPNPFNPITTIEFSLKKQSSITLKVYNSLGKEISFLINHESLQSGSYKYIFNAENLTSGIYFYKLEILELNSSNNIILTKKMLLIK